jgi:hypothetical protein
MFRTILAMAFALAIFILIPAAVGVAGAMLEEHLHQSGGPPGPLLFFLTSGLLFRFVVGPLPG